MRPHAEAALDDAISAEVEAARRHTLNPRTSPRLPTDDQGHKR
jgi:hypothetical protein